MAKFNIGDFASVSQFEFMDTRKNRANQKLENLLEFFDGRECLDVAIRLMEDAKNDKGQISYAKITQALDKLKNKEVEITGDEKKDKEAQLMQDLATMLRTSISCLNGCTEALGNDVIATLYSFLLELKQKKEEQNSQSWLTAHIGWKTGVFCAVALILAIISYWLLF